MFDHPFRLYIVVLINGRHLSSFPLTLAIQKELAVFLTACMLKDCILSITASTPWPPPQMPSALRAHTLRLSPWVRLLGTFATAATGVLFRGCSNGYCKLGGVNS